MKNKQTFISKFTYFILSTFIILTSATCGGSKTSNDTSARPQLENEVNEILHATASLDQRISTLPEGEGPSFSEKNLTLDQIETWLSDVILVSEKASNKVFEQVDAIRTDDTQDFNNQDNPFEINGNMGGKLQGIASLMGHPDNVAMGSYLTQIKTSYENYSEYYDSIVLNGDSHYLFLGDCFALCENIEEHRISTLKVSGKINPDNSYKGYRARVAFDLEENGSGLITTSSGEALIESGGIKYHCSFSGKSKIDCENNP